jgi:hypothetical protein
MRVVIRGTLAKLGHVIIGLAYLGFVICGLCMSLVDLAIAGRAAGIWGMVIGIVLLPVTYLVAPWYALIAWGMWVPLVIEYGGGIISLLLFIIGSTLIARDE